MPGTLTSKRFRVDDLAAAVDFCFERGWTDGLPVIPPTESSVRADRHIDANWIAQ